MEKIKNALSRAIHSPRLPLYAFALVTLIAHLFMTRLFSDDVWFYAILDGKENTFEAIRDFLTYRRQAWSSRTLIEGALIVLVQHMWLWKIIDSVAIIYIIFELSRLLNPEKSLLKNIIIAVTPLAFPLWILYEVGFVATSINYIIPFACALPTISILYRSVTGRDVLALEYAIALPFLLFACFSEIICALVLLVALGCVVWKFVSRMGVPYAEIACAMIAIVYIVYHLSCAGNDARAEQEALTWLPEHSSLNLIEKVELGLRAMIFSLFMYDKNIVFVLMCLAIALVVTLKTKRPLKIVFAWLPFAISSIFGVLSPILTKLQFVSGIKSQILVALQAPKITLGGVLCDLVAVFLLFCVLFSLREVIEGTPEYVLLFYALGIGSATKIALGLSPTVWASGNRGATFLFISIAITLGVAVYQLITLIRERYAKTKTEAK